MKKQNLILSLTLFGVISSISGCVSLPAPKPLEPSKDLCKAVHVPPPFPKVAQIDINEERINYDDGGLQVLQTYAATREALKAACGK